MSVKLIYRLLNCDYVWTFLDKDYCLSYLSPNGKQRYRVLFCSRMQFASTRVPIFSEKAQIISVDTLDGLACTHEVRRHVRLIVNDLLSSPCIFSPSSPFNQVAVPPGCTYEPLKPRTGPPVKVREN